MVERWGVSLRRPPVKSPTKGKKRRSGELTLREPRPESLPKRPVRQGWMFCCRYRDTGRSYEMISKPQGLWLRNGLTTVRQVQQPQMHENLQVSEEPCGESNSNENSSNSAKHISKEGLHRSKTPVRVDTKCDFKANTNTWCFRHCEESSEEPSRFNEVPLPVSTIPHVRSEDQAGASANTMLLTDPDLLHSSCHREIPDQQDSPSVTPPRCYYLALQPSSRDPTQRAFCCVARIRNTPRLPGLSSSSESSSGWLCLQRPVKHLVPTRQGQTSPEMLELSSAVLSTRAWQNWSCLTISA